MSRNLVWGLMVGEGGNTEVILGERRSASRGHQSPLCLQCVLALRSCKVSDQTWNISHGKMLSAAAGEQHWPPSTWPVAAVVVITEQRGAGFLFTFSLEAGKTCSKESRLSTSHKKCIRREIRASCRRVVLRKLLTIRELELIEIARKDLEEQQCTADETSSRRFPRAFLLHCVLATLFLFPFKSC